MKNYITNLLYLLILFSISIIATSNEKITSPEKYFGFKPGTDRMMFGYDELISYLKVLEKESDQLKLVESGVSELGKKIYIAFISNSENISNLERLKTINKELALNDKLTSEETKKYVEEGKVFLMATLSMHSNEVGPSQAAPTIVYNLITNKNKEISAKLDDVVYMMIPCHNPDGMDMVVNHYKKYKGTKYERTSNPGVYHKYVGHNINRDFVVLSQSENKAVANMYNNEWLPQVMVEKHQMGQSGVRYFVPPMHDPIAQNIDEGIWNWTQVLGSAMLKDMTKDGCEGVTTSYLFDDYWPGSTETCLWKNVIGLLTEAASTDHATPVYVEPNELGAYGKGLSEYKKGINMPLPWNGGWWRLGDIVKYEISSTNALIKACSVHKKDILEFRNSMCKKEVVKGKTLAPAYFIFPKQQNDKSEFVNFLNLMKEHGVKVFTLNKDIVIDNTNYFAGDVVIPLAQPYRAFIKEVLETQKFPLRHYTPGGKAIRPYDIASWSLPLHRGLKQVKIDKIVNDVETSLTECVNFDFYKSNSANTKYYLLDVKNNESFKIAFNNISKGNEVHRITEDYAGENFTANKGSFVIASENVIINDLSVAPFELNEIPESSKELKQFKIALVEHYFHDMDAGWTRFIFDEYGVSYTVLRPSEFETTDLAENFDIVIFPNSRKSVLMQGKYGSNGNYYTGNYPPEYTKGIGTKGKQKLLDFIEAGGKIIAWGNSTEIFSGELKNKTTNEEFRLPFSDISAPLEKSGLYMPGSFVKLNLKSDHPVTYGLEKEIGVFYRGKPVFSTSIPGFDMDRRTLATFPEENILLSGYAENEKGLANKTAAVWLQKGKGQLILFAFNPQFRASTQGSYKLLFNSILM